MNIPEFYQAENLDLLVSRIPYHLTYYYNEANKISV